MTPPAFEGVRWCPPPANAKTERALPAPLHDIVYEALMTTHARVDGSPNLSAFELLLNSFPGDLLRAGERVSFSPLAGAKT